MWVFRSRRPWYRFIVPIFLHGGVLHFAFNMSFQLRTGLQMERDWGWWRMALIYFTRGIAGFIFGGNFSPFTPSVGCSGVLYGPCTVIDLFQNLKMMTRPFMDLLNLIVTVMVSLGIGLLPFVDNFAHVSGFVTGIFAGLLFMPSLTRTRAARIRKIVFMIASFIVLLVLYDGMITMFYNGIWCDWCKYLNCIPGLPWCADKWGTTPSNFY
ncbi:rhomboid family-domain-containing protein [Cladochytrium replicatum]|nr:rhomboid family-domain-containing protein [Cladochytrium replicatum]